VIADIPPEAGKAAKRSELTEIQNQQNTNQSMLVAFSFRTGLARREKREFIHPELG
jgi:hypothetical protein